MNSKKPVRSYLSRSSLTNGPYIQPSKDKKSTGNEKKISMLGSHFLHGYLHDVDIEMANFEHESKEEPFNYVSRKIAQKRLATRRSFIYLEPSAFEGNEKPRSAFTESITKKSGIKARIEDAASKAPPPCLNQKEDDEVKVIRSSPNLKKLEVMRKRKELFWGHLEEKTHIVARISNSTTWDFQIRSDYIRIKVTYSFTGTILEKLGISDGGDIETPTIHYLQLYPPAGRKYDLSKDIILGKSPCKEFIVAQMDYVPASRETKRFKVVTEDLEEFPLD